MHGHGYAPPPPKRPSTGVLVVLRVIFAAVPLLSIGFLAWVATLRVALVTRKAADWWIFVGSLAAMGISFGYLSTDHTDDFSSPNGNVGMIILLLNAAACTGYFLFADIRHYSRPHPFGYPQAASPYATPVPQQPVAPVRQVPVMPPPPQRPAPARIDQVRAELDELSDYLRKRDGQHEDGRDGR